jgi:hypothetical protein
MRSAAAAAAPGGRSALQGKRGRPRRGPTSGHALGSSDAVAAPLQVRDGVPSSPGPAQLHPDPAVVQVTSGLPLFQSESVRRGVQVRSDSEPEHFTVHTAGAQHSGSTGPCFQLFQGGRALAWANHAAHDAGIRTAKKHWLKLMVQPTLSQLLVRFI